MELNIAENRNHLNYSKWIYVKRILWTFGKFFFRNSPRIAFGYRNTILRLFGAKIGKHVHIYSSTVIWFPWNLEIGDWSAIGEETLIYMTFLHETITVFQVVGGGMILGFTVLNEVRMRAGGGDPDPREELRP